MNPTVITVNRDGTFTVRLGIYAEQSGMFRYDLTRMRIALLELQRKLSFGNYLYGELGHPPATHPIARNEWNQRASSIDIMRAAFCLESLMFYDIGELGGETRVEVLGVIRPSGPHAKEFRKMLDDRNGYLSFGLRSLNENDSGIRRVISIVTWDVLYNGTRYRK